MSFMVHCDFDSLIKNQHFQSIFLRESQKDNTVYVNYAFNNVDNSGRPLMEGRMKKTVVMDIYFYKCNECICNTQHRGKTSKNY